MGYKIYDCEGDFVGTITDEGARATIIIDVLTHADFTVKESEEV